MIRALIVDDDEASRVGNAKALRDEGLEVETAVDAEDCLNTLSSSREDSQRFDVVILDLRMPGKDGDEILADIRRDHPFTAIIILTAFAEVDTAVATMWKGAYHYLNKPCDPRKNLLPVLRAGVAENRLKRMQQQLFIDPSLNFDAITDALKDTVVADSQFFLLIHSPESRETLRVQFRCDNEAHLLDVGEEIDANRPLARMVYGRQRAVHRRTKPKVAAIEPLVEGAGSLLATSIPGFEGQSEGMLDLESLEERAFDYYTESVMKSLANLVGLSLGLDELLKLNAKEKSDRVLAASTRTLAHHIRNPLHVLRSSLALACEIDLAGAPLDSVERLQANLRRNGILCGEIEDVVDQLFFIGTPVEPDLQQASLKTMLLERMHNYQALADQRNVEFRFVPPESDALIKADRKLLVRAFDVVIENAIEACDSAKLTDGGRHLVELDLQVDQNVVRAAIVDTGPGVSPEVANRLFDPLFSTKGSNELRGAGLYTAERIVIQHQGRINLDKQHRAKRGAKFLIEIPLDQSPNRQTEHEVADVQVG